VAVEIQNRSPRIERISDLEGVVSLEVLSVTNECPHLVPVLMPNPRLPALLQPMETLSVYFEVTFSTNCVPDRQRSRQSEAHHDYVYRARCDQEVVNDNRDTFPGDDVCPRAPAGVVTTAGAAFSDPGCGNKRWGGTLGAPVVTDVIVK
jgi:hypothetical protein